LTYGLFLGCVTPNRYPGIESASRAVLDALNVDYKDLVNTTCCPAPGIVRSINEVAWLATAARNLCAAEQEGVDILTLCNGCYGSLFEAGFELDNDPEKKEMVNKALGEIGFEYKGPVRTRHLVDVLYNDVGVSEIEKHVKRPIEKRMGIHYGCHFLKPSKHRRLDDPERPKILEEMVRVVGGVNVEYEEKHMCCGAGGGVRARIPEIAQSITKEKLDNMKATSVELILDVCPLCHLQLDRTQELIGGYDIPVLHISQLLGLAFGVEEKILGFGPHAIPVEIGDIG
jgi:heterodisulfide reductase subunit B